jgi:excisionase family DNA binding protein
MSIEDLAGYLGDSKRTIYKYIATGDCPPYIRISAKNIKFDRADVDAWLESKKVFPQGGQGKGALMSWFKPIKTRLGLADLPWTPRTQEVFQTARALAASHGQSVSSEHVLLGILACRDCLANRILQGLGVHLDEFKGRLENILREVAAADNQVQDSDESVERIIQCTYDEAQRLGHDYIGAEHVLAAVFLAELGRGWQILQDMGVSLEAIRQETTMLVVCPGLHE